MRIFVSYSRRDGVVTEQMLEHLRRYLDSISTPFIHCLQPEQGRWEQLRVMRELFRAHAVLLVDSPAARKSPWVKLELTIARLLFCPILRLDASDLLNVNEV
ncbi:TIR domain-containing protein [Paludibacterium sp. dN 18-1]|uniref:TIR domain-containing protein n=1 Tax=Paludibacterium denitrificans TaxID=2675226 RepID=A0A844GEI1_9NEIS|nr:TIR domain-containing protein [Paludibacterium denitrificans]